MHPAPVVGTFHAAGESSSYQVLRPVSCAGSPSASTARSSCRRTRWSSSSRYLGGEYDILFNGVEIDEIALDRADADRAPDDLLLRPPRGAQGPRRAARRVRARCPPTSGCGSPATGPTPPACAREYADDDAHRVARPDQRRREVRPPARRRRVLRPVAARRVVRRRADRGDGGRHAGRRQRPRRLPQRRDRRRRRPARRRRATSTRSPPRCGEVLADDALAAPAARRRARAGRATSR